MKKYIIHILLIVISVCFSANISIYVFDYNESLELKGANIILKDSNGNTMGGSTGNDGKYIFSNIKKGDYELDVSFIGYKNYNQNILINSELDYDFQCPMLFESILIPELQIISDINQPYNKLTGSASVIDFRTIKEISPIGTQEMLEHVPGIHAFSDDGIGNSRISVGIRGLNPRRSSRVLIMEDGIPIQPALYVYPNMYYNPPVERIDGLQVIKGSGTVKYGPQTMGGIINYYTNRPQNEYGGNLKLSAGENGYMSVFSELSGFGSENIKNAVQLLFKQGDGFRDNNDFMQINGTFKSNYKISKNKNIYLKFGNNYENSNATYTGLTEYSFEKDPNFNPKKDDNFKIIRSSLDIIETEKLKNNLIRNRKIYGSYFDRKWWRENDIFIKAADLGLENPEAQAPNSIFDLIRIGNGKDNFGILRTFYVFGIEQSYSYDSYFMSYPSKYEYSNRVYWERFIDDKKIGSSSDAREGIYYEPAEICNDENLAIDGTCFNFNDLNNNNIYDDSETIVGQSHHYETTAFSSYISTSTDFRFITINLGLRLEIFEQERIDRLDGSTYLDKTTFEILPSISFLKDLEYVSFFGGIHRGYTAPSSGALKVTNFTLDAGLDLKSEKSWNKEIGIRSNFLNKNINYELSFFHIDIEDMVAAGRGTKFNNLGKINSMGSEFYLKARLTNFLNINFSHTYLKSEIKDGILEQYTFISTGGPVSINGNSLPYTPKYSFLIGFDGKLNNFSYRIDYKYVDKVYTDFHNLEDYGKLGIQGPVPSYNIINTSINYNISEKIKINLLVKNLLDKKYIGSRLHSNPGQDAANLSSGILPGPRRQINFGFNYNF